MFGGAPHPPGAGMLTQHDRTGVEGDHEAILGFVAPGAGADVDDAAGITKRAEDAGRDPRIGAPVAAISHADRVVSIE